MYVSGIHRYPARYNPFGIVLPNQTERVDVYFDGPADETLSQVQTPSLFFFHEERTASQTYRAEIDRLNAAAQRLPIEQRVSLRRMFGIARNVVISWVRPDVPQRLRAIVQGCLGP